MKISTQLKRYTQNSKQTQGFSLIELIVGGVVSLVVISVTLGLVVEQRRLFLGDQQKTNSNQNLRTATEFIGTDIKQSGERITSDDLPVIRLIAGASANEPDALVLQRQLLSDRLEICQDISTGDSEIIVADSNNSNCFFSDGTSPADNVDDTLGEFKRYRCDLDNSASCARGNDDDEANYGSTGNAAISTVAGCDDECVFAYIYDPVNDQGEFFLYTDETFEPYTYVDDNGTPSDTSDDTTVSAFTNQLKVVPLGPGNQFANSYNVADEPIIYILEERKYGLCDGVLTLVTNRQPEYGTDCPYPNSDPRPVRLVDDIADFQVQIQTSGGAVDTWNENLSSIDDFKDVESVTITLETEPSDLITTPSNTLSLSTDFFPRNAGNAE